MNDGALLKTDVAAMRKHKGVLHARNTNTMCERKRFTNDRRVENKQKALCAHEENAHRACAKRAHNKGVLRAACAHEDSVKIIARRRLQCEIVLPR